MNKEDKLFVNSEYLFNNQSFNIKLERIIERGYWKLLPSEVMNVRFERSKNQFIHFLIPFIINVQESFSYLPRSAQ